jgi:hypothetical protein
VWFGIAIVLVSAGRAVPAEAQHAGLPVHLSPAHARLTGGYLDFGSSAGWAGSGRLDRLGARLRFTTPKLQIVAGAGRVSADGGGLDPGISFGGLLAYSFGQRTTRRLGLFAGVGWTDLDGPAGAGLQQLDAPVGLGFALHAPSPIGVFELWGAPRLHLRSSRRTSLDIADRVTRVGLGLSTGIGYTRPRSQLGLGLSADALVIGDPERGGTALVASIGVSLHYLRVNR